MLEDLNYEDFAAQLNTRFKLTELDGTDLELVSATRRDGAGVQEMFSLIFRGPKETLFQQSTYRLSHPILGEGDLFLVPVAQEADGFLYEAGFNRLIQPA